MAYSEMETVGCAFTVIAKFRKIVYSNHICQILEKGRENTISSQILQNTIDELHAITRVDFAVMDVEGNEVATTMQPEFSHSSRLQYSLRIHRQTADCAEHIFKYTMKRHWSTS